MRRERVVAQTREEVVESDCDAAVGQAQANLYLVEARAGDGRRLRAGRSETFGATEPIAGDQPPPGEQPGFDPLPWRLCDDSVLDLGNLWIHHRGALGRIHGDDV